MKKIALVSMLAMLVVAVAATAVLAAPAKAKKETAKTKEVKVVVTSDGEDEDIDLPGDDDGPAGPGGKHVIVRRIVMNGGEGACGMGRGGRGHGGHAACGMGPGGMGGPGGMCGEGMGPGGMCGPRGHEMGRGGMCGPGGMGAGCLAGVMGQLDLNADQKAKLKDLHEANSRREIQARADLEIARLDLRKLMSAEKRDAAAIDAQIDKLAKLRADDAKARVHAQADALALLTPEQLKKAHELMQGGPGACPMGGPAGGMKPGECGMGGAMGGMKPGECGMGGAPKAGKDDCCAKGGAPGKGKVERHVRTVKIVRDSVEVKK